MGSYHSPTRLDGGKMVGSRWEVQTGFYLPRFIYLFTYLFVWFNLPRKYLVTIYLCNEKTLLSSSVHQLDFQNIPMKMEKPLCIAKCQLFAKWTWRI